MTDSVFKSDSARRSLSFSKRPAMQTIEELKASQIEISRALLERKMSDRAEMATMPSPFESAKKESQPFRPVMSTLKSSSTLTSATLARNSITSPPRPSDPFPLERRTTAQGSDDETEVLQSRSESPGVPDVSDLSHWAPESTADNIFAQPVKKIVVLDQMRQQHFKENHLSPAKKHVAESITTTYRTASSVPDVSSISDADSSIISNHLPSWEALKGKLAAPTSFPISIIKSDMEFAVRQLLTVDVCAEMIVNPLGRSRFRTWLAAEGNGGENKLDMYCDTFALENQVNKLRAQAEVVHDTFLSSRATAPVVLSSAGSMETYTSFRQIAQMDVAFRNTQQELLNSLFKGEFHRFLKNRLVETVSMQLSHEVSGLGDSYCLTNPRLRDHPISLISKGFEASMGYAAGSIIGRNCRFLQGPNTDQRSVARIREALNAGKGITELLLNYRRDGTPFYCLLCIIPLRDSVGELSYFLGSQINVTGLMAHHETRLSFLMGNKSVTSSVGVEAHEQSFSPSVMKAAASAGDSRAMDLMRDLANLGGQNHVAAGQIKSKSNDDQNLGYGSGSGGKNGSFWNGAFNFLAGRKGKGGDQLGSMSGDKQKILGAESFFSAARGDSNVEDQISQFENTYSRVLIFRKTKREIIFATAPLLNFLGLPSKTTRELFSSVLIHADLLNFVHSSVESDGKLVKSRIKAAVKEGQALSLQVGLKYFGKTYGESLACRYTMLHMTPLVDKDGLACAFAVVLS